MTFCTITLIVTALVILAAAPCQLVAQNTTSGALTGVVTDSSGAVVQRARVELKDNSNGTTDRSVADAEGRQEREQVPDLEATL
jgi:hypothetical protein